MSLGVAVLACVALAATMAGLAAGSRGARVAVVLAALVQPLPLFVEAPAVLRGGVAVWLTVQALRGLDLARAPLSGGFGRRLVHLVAFVDSRQVRRAACRLDGPALGRAGLWAALLGGLVFLVEMVAGGPARPAAWLLGPVAVLAVFELAAALLATAGAAAGFVVPATSQAPYLSRSVAEFWSRRWNTVVSGLLRQHCYSPLGCRGPTSALFVTFAASAAIHAWIAAMTLGWRGAAGWGAFFLLQPLFVAAERHLGVRRWPPALARAWTLGTLLAVSPLFVDPALALLDFRPLAAGTVSIAGTGGPWER